MKSLWDQLTDVLPLVLPKTPDEAINGTALIKRVRPQVSGAYEDASFRVHFSHMVKRPDSVIARREGRHGYYLRPLTTSEAAREVPPEAIPEAEKSDDGGAAPIDSQSEEKFRALFMRYSEFENQFAMRIDHTRASRSESGVNKWKFPDVVLLEWDIGHVTDEGYRLDNNLLEVKRSLGEQPFRLTSVELKVALQLSDFRQSFFQCVSNSKWAHHSVLAVACPLDDETLIEELRRLGTSYDVTIVSYSIKYEDLKAFPPASEIRSMPESEIEKLASKINLVTIVSGRHREGLDWDHIKDMRDRTSDYIDLFEWLASCLKSGRAYSFDDYKKIKEIEKGA